MVKKLFTYIFIYTLLVGCNTQSSLESTETGYFLEVTAPNLELDANGYYHIEFLEGYTQTFSTLDANTGSEEMPQKVMWESDSGIYESYTGDFISCVNPASYTNHGIAHTVLSVWVENISDTIIVYAWYVDEQNHEHMNSMGIIVEDEI